MWVYIKVTPDKYEHIEAIADTPKQLAEMLQVSVDYVFQQLIRYNGVCKRVWIDL